jgi:hypothetical protein
MLSCWSCYFMLPYNIQYIMLSWAIQHVITSAPTPTHTLAILLYHYTTILPLLPLHHSYYHTTKYSSNYTTIINILIHLLGFTILLYYYSLHTGCWIYYIYYIYFIYIYLYHLYLLYLIYLRDIYIYYIYLYTFIPFYDEYLFIFIWGHL